MSDPMDINPPSRGQFLVYQTEDGRINIDVRLEGETIWLTQAHMAELFQTSVPNVSMHLRNIYAEGELQAAATIKEFLIVRTEGKREVSRAVDFYNLDAIISVGYRVKSAVATRFRIWATTGQTAAEIIHTRADSAKPSEGNSGGGIREVSRRANPAQRCGGRRLRESHSAAASPAQTQESCRGDMSNEALNTQARALEQTIAANVAEILEA